MAKNTIIETPSINLLGAGTILKGDISSDGDFRIDGQLSGSIQCKGKVVIGATGMVEGEIICRDIDISGQVKAQIQVSELLSLKSTARLTGDIQASQLAIEPGAIFSGTCKMESSNQGRREPSSDEDKKVKQATI